MPDQRKTLQDFQQLVSKFRDERGWKKYHNPKNLVISILVEAAELAEHFQWEAPEEPQSSASHSRGLQPRVVESLRRGKDRERKLKISFEIADVMWYLLSLANRLDIDLTDAFLKKFAHNTKKFPKDRAHDVEFVRKQREKYRKLGK